MNGDGARGCAGIKRTVRQPLKRVRIEGGYAAGVLIGRIEISAARMDVYGAVGPRRGNPVEVYHIAFRGERAAGADGKHLDIVVIPVGHVQPPAVRADDGRDRLGRMVLVIVRRRAVGAAGKGRQRAALVIDGVSRYRSVALVGNVDALSVGRRRDRRWILPGRIRAARKLCQSARVRVCRVGGNIIVVVIGRVDKVPVVLARCAGRR
ncbi:MAG: hypothetical protein BWY57_03126 [Betaproteobacteria bacterium ADurb.Bin341]|nr:MAG: hypothetical protein BWY57_03126 [Betaproteobacteria bacterium ADurb.Bin341]